MTRSHVLVVAASVMGLALSACTGDDSDDGDGGIDTSTGGSGDGSGSATDDDGDGSGGGMDSDSDSGSDSASDGGTDSDGSGSDSGTDSGEADECPVPDPGWGPFAEGEPAPHFTLLNHRGEEVSLCDYYGMPVVIDVSAMWCGPCQLLADFMAGNDAAGAEVFGAGGWADYYGVPVRNMVHAGTVIWLTVITQNELGGPATLDDAAAWDAAYPVPNIQVLPDTAQEFEAGLQIEAFPTVFLLNADLTWLSNEITQVFFILKENLPDPGPP